MEITWRVISEEGQGRMGEANVQGISIIGRHKIDRGVKNSIGNGEAKELLCITHGHELRRRESWRVGDREVQGREG